MVPNKVFIVFVVLGSMLAEYQTAQAQDSGRYEEAIASFVEKRYNDTEALIESYAKTDSLGADWVLLQAKLYAAQAHFGQAADRFRDVLTMTNQQHLEASTWLNVNGYNISEKLQKDLPGLQKLVDESPDDAPLRRRLAEALAADGQFEESVKHYRQFLKSDHVSVPGVTDALIAIAASGSNHSLGEEIAEKYASKYSDNDDLQMRLGYFRLWRGKYDGATTAFKKALALNSSNEAATNGIESVALRIKEVVDRGKDSDALFNGVEKYPLDTEKRFELVDHLLKDGLIYDASKHLVTLEQQLPDSAKTRSKLNSLVAQIKNTSLAGAGSQLDRNFLQTIKRPRDSEGRFDLVESLVSRDRYYDAYDELVMIPDTLQPTERWTSLFENIDEGLIQSHGESPVFQIDRLAHRLRIDPENLEIRYALVDSLTSANRYAEALHALTTIPGLSQGEMLEDLGYQGKLTRIAMERPNYSKQRVDTLRAQIEQASGARLSDLRRELIDHYLVLGEESLAENEFETLIELDPQNVELNLDWIDFLRVTEQHVQATSVADELLKLNGDDPEVQKAFVLSSMRTGLDELATDLMTDFVDDPTLRDTDFLLEVANYYVDSSLTSQAESLLVRIDSLDGGHGSPRFSSVQGLLNREIVRIADSERFEDLNNARISWIQNEFPAAIEKFDAYLKDGAVQLRSEVAEFARTQLAGGDSVGALVTFGDLQEEEFSYEIQKEIVRIKAEMEDYQGVLQLVDSLTAHNPQDFESQFLQAGALQNLGVFDRAENVVDDIRTSTQGSELWGDQLTAKENDIRTQLRERGLWTKYDFSGIIVPTAYSIHAEGGGTTYERRTQGVRAEVTLPIGGVASVGFNSHFISGSRRLVPEAEFVRTSINQMFGSVFIDLTPPTQSEKAPYTNRLFVEAGLYDYEGARSVGYFNVRYWKQVKGQFIGAIGLRTDEGSIDLWSAGGGQFNLRLTQFDLDAEYVGAMPDSVVRLAGRLAINVVNDNLGLLSGSQDGNVGSDLMLEAGYKVIDHTYAGLAYHQLNYESRTDTYFSPENWELTEFFLEHEREAFSRWYVRLRGSIGAISRSSGQMAQRLEADVIKRIGDNLSITLQSTLGETSRALGGGVSSLFNRYNTFHLSGSVRWTL